ncbi:hypothetical protein [Anaerovorax odorimutans]|uniref:hypothetical protein n=1 Tax=Anaerovorax odorimutans TaxID=109327 RepID=UPI0003F4D55B|nr:hypothetical protein [Anaerovorax odorimutans]
MYILNQDRDQLFFKSANKPLLWHEVFNNGVFYGCSLLLGKDLLGTFDSTEEVIKEVEQINSCKEEIYAVSGYSDYDGREDIERALYKLYRF